MQQTLQLDWDFLEIEEEEAWVEMTTMTADENADRPHGRGGRRAWLSIMALAVVAMAIVGVRLWLIAEAGAAAIERDLGALTQAETIGRRKFIMNDLPTTAVESVRFNAVGAMVWVRITETLASGESVAHSETRFYKPAGSRWRRTAPIASFWGRAMELETATLHFDFHELDRSYVETIAAPLEAQHQALRTLLGLPAPVQPLTVTIAPNSVPIMISAPDGAIMLSSPLLHYASSEQRRVEILTDVLRSHLTARMIDEASRYYSIGANWQLHMNALHEWLILRSEDLPELLASETNRERLPGFQCSPQAFKAMLQDNPADYYRAPGYADYRTDAFTIGVMAFFDCLIYANRIEMAPALLAGFGQHESWSTLAPDVFGVRVEELANLWTGNQGAADSPTASP